MSLNRWPTKTKFSQKYSMRMPVNKVHYNPRVNRHYIPITHSLYVLRAKTHPVLCKTGTQRFKGSKRVRYTVLIVEYERDQFPASILNALSPITNCDQLGKTKQMLLTLHKKYHCAEGTSSYSHPKRFRFCFQMRESSTRHNRA